MVKILPKQIEQLVLSPRLSDAEAGRMVRVLVSGRGELPERIALAVDLALGLLTWGRRGAATQKAEQRAKARKEKGK